jgi:2-polyprenyl-6-hydroxyphenyl methylase/3-demethylubiquinone-9 3-methyltransferase
MKRNDQSLYQDYAKSMWKGTHRFQRLLAKQVYPRLEYFDRIMPDWKGLNILDLGCGGGFMSEALTKRGANVIGIDPSPEMLEPIV